MNTTGKEKVKYDRYSGQIQMALGVVKFQDKAFEIKLTVCRISDQIISNLRGQSVLQ